MFLTISECTCNSFPPSFSELLFETEKREGEPKLNAIQHQ